MAKQSRKSTEPASQPPLPKGKTIVKEAGPGLEDPRQLRQGPEDFVEEIDLETVTTAPTTEKKSSPSTLRVRRKATG